MRGGKGEIMITVEIMIRVGLGWVGLGWVGLGWVGLYVRLISTIDVNTDSYIFLLDSLL